MTSPMNSFPGISDWALHICLLLKEFFLRYHGESKKVMKIRKHSQSVLLTLSCIPLILVPLNML